MSTLVNSIVMGDERSSGLIKGVPFGVIAPGASVIKTLYLLNSGAPGNRMIDISIRSRSIATPPEPMADGSILNELADASETLQTLVVPTVEPMQIVFEVVYRRALGQRRGLADLESYEDTFWDDGEGGEAVVNAKMKCEGPWALEVVDVRLVKEVSIVDRFCSYSEAEVRWSGWKSGEGDRKLSVREGTRRVSCWYVPLIQTVDVDYVSRELEYLPGDEFCDMCRITLAPESGQDFDKVPIPGPGKYEMDWRR